MADLDDVADLLARGFAGRLRDYWIDGLRRMSVRETPEAFPRFGYMLDYDGRPVGALLSIYTSMFSSFPALSRPATGMRVEIIQHDAQAVDGLSEADVALLVRHAAYGCLSLVCRTAEGRGLPFVLQPMRIRQIRLPAMRMIYCPMWPTMSPVPAPSAAFCSGVAGSRWRSMLTAA
jgi:hypothetical protein